MEYKHTSSACSNNEWKQGHRSECEQEGYKKNLRENRDGKIYNYYFTSKNCQILLVIKKEVITVLRFHLTPVKMTIIKNNTYKTCNLHCGQEYKVVVILKISLEVSKKLSKQRNKRITRNETTVHLAVLLLTCPLRILIML